MIRVSDSYGWHGSSQSGLQGRYLEDYLMYISIWNHHHTPQQLSLYRHLQINEEYFQLAKHFCKIKQLYYNLNSQWILCERNKTKLTDILLYILHHFQTMIFHRSHSLLPHLTSPVQVKCRVSTKSVDKDFLDLTITYCSSQNQPCIKYIHGLLRATNGRLDKVIGSCRGSTCSWMCAILK